MRANGILNKIDKKMRTFSDHKISYCLLLLVFALAGLASCKKQIFIADPTGVTSYLVVDGHLAVGDTTVIKLSRTVALSGDPRSNPELNAKVTVEGTDGSAYTLVSNGKGEYRAVGLALSTTQTYSLKITTADGKKYASDQIPVKNSPAIDSLGYVVHDNGLEINANTHDPSGKTQYYRWDYTDTYIVQSKYESKYKVIHYPLYDTTEKRAPADQIYKCWVTDTSSVIVLGSSTKLAEDRIAQQEVAFLQTNAVQLRFRYSILVKQYALTQEAYNYFDLLNRNSGQVGGVFDAQPSELTGNIHCLSNPNEPVIGYITAGAVAQQRLFIDHSALPATWSPDLSYDDGCYLILELYLYYPPGTTGLHVNQVHDFIYNEIEVPVDTTTARTMPYIPAGNLTNGYYSAKPYCADCRLRGTNKQPEFWK